MHPKTPKWLEDIVNRSTFILDTTANRTLADYAADPLLRAAMERNFQIVGEALVRIERTDPETAARFTDVRKIVGFRNRLVHGYDTTDDTLVWGIIQESLPILKAEAESLLAEAEADADF